MLHAPIKILVSLNDVMNPVPPNSMYDSTIPH